MIPTLQGNGSKSFIPSGSTLVTEIAGDTLITEAGDSLITE